MGFGLAGSAIGRVFAGTGVTKIADNDRVLVLLRLNGGNDGLATVFPMDQYANLTIQRPSIIVPDNLLLDIGDHDLALHPALSGMHGLIGNGQLGIIQNVAADSDGDRSHFRVTDMWMTGINDENHPQKDEGWLGRIFDKEYVGYPVGYPNGEDTDPFAVSISYSASLTCEGDLANFAHAVVDPANAVNLSGGTVWADGTANADLQQHLSTLAVQSNAWNAQITNAMGMGTTVSTMYGTDSLSLAFQKIAQMISGGLKTRVYTVDIGGFDYHSGQVDIGSPTTGTHTTLWDRISTALTAFQDDLNQQNLDERVATMTFSEFGRQTAENGSYGTDHGEASCMFVMGTCVNSLVIGDNPQIDSVVSNGAAVPMDIDIRDIQASVLRDWFGVPESIIEQNFEYYGGITYYPVIDGCALPVDPDDPTTGISEVDTERRSMKVFPNPCREKVTVEGLFPKGDILIKIQDLMGRDVEAVAKHVPQEDRYTFTLDGLNFPAGNYVLSAYTTDRTFNKRQQIIKLD